MVAKAYLTTNDAVILDRDTARNACLCSNYAAFADINVVTDLYEIIYLCAGSDAGNTQSSTVDTRIGSDLHVIFDDDRTDLREFVIISARVLNVTKTVRPDDSAGMNDTADFQQIRRRTARS